MKEELDNLDYTMIITIIWYYFLLANYIARWIISFLISLIIPS